MSYVAKQTGIHLTTIRKNKVYWDYCEDKFKKFISKDVLLKVEEVEELRQTIRFREHEINNLKNEIKGLRVLNTKLLNGENVIEEQMEQKELKKINKILLGHFVKYLIISENEIIDPHAGILPKVLYKNEKLKQILD